MLNDSVIYGRYNRSYIRISNPVTTSDKTPVIAPDNFEGGC